MGMMVALADERREDKAKKILHTVWGQMQSENKR